MSIYPGRHSTLVQDWTRSRDVRFLKTGQLPVLCPGYQPDSLDYLKQPYIFQFCHLRGRRTHLGKTHNRFGKIGSQNQSLVSFRFYPNTFRGLSGRLTCCRIPVSSKTSRILRPSCVLAVLQQKNAYLCRIVYISDHTSYNLHLHLKYCGAK